MSSWIFNVSKDGDIKASGGYLFQCLTTLAGKRIFYMCECSLYQFMSVCTRCLLLCPQEPLNVCLHLLTPTHQLFTHIDEILSEPSFLQAEQSLLFQTLLIWQMLHSVSHLHGSLLDFLPCVYASVVLESPELDIIIHNMIGNVFKVWKQEFQKKSQYQKRGNCS